MAQVATDTLEEFSEKKERLNKRANEWRARRDELNDKTRQWARKRDELNAKVRELVDQANEHREKRDALNAKVQEAKKVRDEFNQKAAEARAEFNEARKDSKPDKGPSLSRLKKQLRKLEYEQMTKVLSPKKERELIERMQDIQKQIEEKEEVLSSDGESQDLWGAYQQVKEKAEQAHQDVTELAEQAQEQHDSMVSLFEEADEVRKEADGAQEKFVENKVEADRVHQEYIEMVNQIRDYEKVVIGLRQKERKARKEVSEAEAKQQAEEIYEKFKSGEKLSTDDLMTLQKAGFL